jgi:hypothetical protein
MTATMLVLDDGRVATLPLLEREIEILREASNAADRLGMQCAAHAFEIGALRRTSAINTRLDFVADVVLTRALR